MDTPDGVLIERSRLGDPTAFEQLYRRYGAGVFRFVLGLVSTREDAEDLTVAVFVKAWVGLNSLRDSGAFRTWLYRIALRLVQDHRKTAKPTEQLSETLHDPASNPLQAVSENTRREQLRSAVASLPQQQRQVVALYYGQGIAVEEIGRTLGLPKGTVISRLARARVALRRLLQDQGDPSGGDG